MSQNSVFDDLENETGERPEYWKPGLGDKLVGKLEDMQELDDSYNPGRKSLLLLIRDEGGQLWSWFPPTAPRRVIVERFLSGLIFVGGSFGAKRLPDVKLKNGSIMKMFAIAPRPSQEDSQERARKIMESRKAEAEGGEAQDELPGIPKKPAQPRGAQPVKSREQTAPDGFVDDVIDDDSIPF